MGNYKKIYCLWSGGWDSTFRILQLVLMDKTEVQPIYIYDKRRRSRKYELYAISRIMKALKEDFSEQSSNLKPLLIISKSGLRRDTEYTTYFRKFDAEYKLGVQYLWFARFCRHYKIHDLEVCFISHVGDTIPEFNLLLESHVEGIGHECKLVEKLENPFLEFFRSFRFPTIHMTKVEMAETAKENGFHSLLQMSWYCFTPLHDGEPCGECHPCKIAGRTRQIYSHGKGTHKPVSGIPLRIKFQMLRNRFWNP